MSKKQNVLLLISLLLLSSCKGGLIGGDFGTHFAAGEAIDLISGKLLNSNNTSTNRLINLSDYKVCTEVKLKAQKNNWSKKSTNQWTKEAKRRGLSCY
jgi:hypothetical protein